MCEDIRVGVYEVRVIGGRLGVLPAAREGGSEVVGAVGEGGGRGDEGAFADLEVDASIRLGSR